MGVFYAVRVLGARGCKGIAKGVCSGDAPPLDTGVRRYGGGGGGYSTLLVVGVPHPWIPAPYRGTGHAFAGMEVWGVERAMGVEPTTTCLEGRGSTAELRPLVATRRA